jgi:signal transduction histidine kinase
LNRTLVRAYLDGSGHEIIEAPDGEHALAIAEDSPPDLVLLDVMMPGMDGFETTRQLKAMFSDIHVPIILITALDDRESRMIGLAAGADEFLTKPIDREVLLLRAGNLLAWRAREVELATRNIELMELRRFQDETMAMLVHDLKSPLSVILASLDYVLGLPEAVSGEAREALTDCKQSGARIQRLVGGILEVAHAESGKLVLRRAPQALAELLRTALGARQHVLQRRGVPIEIALDAELVADIDRDLLARVIENLIDNASRYTPQGGRVKIWGQRAGEAEDPAGRRSGASPAGSWIELRIGNSGPAIPESSRLLVFEKYTQVWDAARGTLGGSVGLGLYFCRLALEAHGGAIWIEESEELPTVFAMRLPAPSAPRDPVVD